MMAANMFEGGSETDSEVYVPFTTLYTVLAGRAFIYVNAASRSPNLSEEAKGEITFFLRSAAAFILARAIRSTCGS